MTNSHIEKRGTVPSRLKCTNHLCIRFALRIGDSTGSVSPLQFKSKNRSAFSIAPFYNMTDSERRSAMNKLRPFRFGVICEQMQSAKESARLFYLKYSRDIFALSSEGIWG